MHAQYDEAYRQEVCCAPLPAADIRSSSRGSSQRPAGDPRRSPVPGNGGLWRRSVGSISRVERRGEAAEHRRSDCPEEVARMQPRVPPTMAAEQAGVSKIGSWWRLALGPPGGESGVASRIETPIRTRNEMFAENLMQVSDVDIVVFPPLTCVPHTRTGQEGPLASPFARKSGPPVLWRRLSLMQ